MYLSPCTSGRVCMTARVCNYVSVYAATGFFIKSIFLEDLRGLAKEKGQNDDQGRKISSSRAVFYREKSSLP